MSNTIPAHAIDVAWAVGADGARPDLLVANVADGHVDATNGHIAVRVPVRGYDGADARLPRLLCQEGARLKAACAIETGDGEGDNDVRTITLRTDAGRAVTTPAEPEQGELFPDVASVLPWNKPQDERPGVLVDAYFSAEYLRVLAGYAKRHCVGGGMLRMTFYETADKHEYHGQAVRVRVRTYDETADETEDQVGDSVVEAVIMPVRP